MTAGSAPTPFVILATQRTGSNWLMGLLDAHPSVTAHDELFLPRELGEDYRGRRDQEFFEAFFAARRRRPEPLARAYWGLCYLSALYRGDEGQSAVGLKLMYGQLWKNPAIWGYLIARRVRIVHLVRGNLLDVVLSSETARARARFHATPGEEVDTPIVRLEPAMLIATLRMLDFRVRAARALLSVMPIRSMEVAYEELVLAPGLLGDVLAFLGAEPAPAGGAKPRFRKLNTAPRRELIENYGEVSAALAGTRFEGHL